MTNTQKQQLESLGWEFVPGHDDGFGKAVPDYWVHEDGERLCSEDPNDERELLARLNPAKTNPTK